MLKNLIISGMLAAAPVMAPAYEVDPVAFYDKESIPNLVLLGTYEYHYVQDYVYTWCPQDYADGTLVVSVEYDCDINVYYRGNWYYPEYAYDDFLFEFNHYNVSFSCVRQHVNDGPNVGSCHSSYDLDNPYIVGGKVNVARFINEYFGHLGSLIDYEGLQAFTLIQITPCPYRSNISTTHNMVQVMPMGFIGNSNSDFVINFLYDGYIGTYPYVYEPGSSIDIANQRQMYNDLVDRISAPLYPILQNFKNSVEQSQNQYNLGYDNGYSYGYGLGHADGWNEGFSADSTAVSIFGGILSIGLIPVDFFLEIFNFEILGINLTAFVTSMLTLMLVIIMMRTIFNGGSKS